MDKSTVCQHALALLGETNYEKHTAPKSVCDMAYPDVVRYANNAAHWSFARNRRTLTPMAAPSINGIRCYLIPADCLKIISITDTASGFKIPHWTIYADRIEIHSQIADTVDLVYTSDLLATQADLPDHAPDFCQYVIHMLAARIAPTITGQLEIATMFEQKAAVYLAQAIYKDARQSGSNDQAPAISSLSSHVNDPSYY